MSVAATVTPLSTVDELIELLLQIVHRAVRHTSVYERALDGLAALAGQVPEDFGQRVGPLLAQVNTIFSSDPPRWGDHCSSDFCFLIANWIEPHRVVASAQPVDTPRGWLMGRLREVALMLQTGVRARLLALPTDEADWIDPSVLADRVLLIGDDALARPLDVAIALARLAPWGRPAARVRLRDAPGVLAALVRVGCGSDEDVDAAPEPLHRSLAWLRGSHAGAPFLFGEPAPPAPAKAELPSDIYTRGTVTPMADGGLFFDPSALPEWQAFQRWHDHRRHTGYGAAWGVSQWPGDVDWLWVDTVLGRREVRSLLDPDAALPSAAVRRVVELLSDDAAEMRTLATDVLVQVLDDGRLTSHALTEALTDRSTLDGAFVSSRTALRVVAALTTVAAVSPLHRVVVGRSLAGSATVWCGLPARPLCAVLELLDEVLTADGLGLVSPDVRAGLIPLASGRSKTARLVTRVLAHPATDGWPTAAAAHALTARCAHAQRRQAAAVDRDDRLRATVKEHPQPGEGALLVAGHVAVDRAAGPAQA
jgi:hypothetical protein